MTEIIGMPVREIHEIELSSVCNLACKYCPHPKLEREKAHMDEATYLRALEHVAYYCAQGTQTELSLTGIGEAILHPSFITALQLARQAIGPDRPLVLATNGVAMTPALAEALRYCGAAVYVSTHRPEKAGPAFEMLKQRGVAVGLNTAFVNDSIDWAGQVKWHASAKVRDCDYLGDGWAVVRQDGAVNACCMDAHSKYQLGSVWDELGSLRTRPIELCQACNLSVPNKFKAAA